MSNGITSGRGRKAGWAAVFVGVGALVILFGWMQATMLDLTQEVRKSQIEGTPFGKRVLASSDRVLDCTDPEGECFKRGQARTADVITTLNLGTVYAVFCVNRNPGASIEAVQRCVRDLYGAPEDGE